MFVLRCDFGSSRPGVGEWGEVTGRGEYWKKLFFRENGEGGCVWEFCIQQALLQQVVLQPEKFLSLGQGWTVVPKAQGGQRSALFRKWAMLIQRAAQQKAKLTKERFQLLVKWINWVRLRGRTCIRNRTELHGNGNYFNCFLFWHSLFCSSHRGIQENYAFWVSVCKSQFNS